MKNRLKLNSQQIRFLKEHTKNKTKKELVEILSQKFNYTYTNNQIEYLKKKYNISSFKNQNKYSLSKEELTFLKNNVKGKTCEELCLSFNKRFNKNVSAKDMEYLKRKNRLVSGVNTRYGKGKEPIHRPIGHELYSPSDDAILIKVAEPNKYIRKQRYIYEQKYGELPKGYVVVSLNGKRDDYNVKNLIAVKEKDYRVGALHKMLFENKELTKVGLLTAQLINKTSELRKEERL